MRKWNPNMSVEADDIDLSTALAPESVPPEWPVSETVPLRRGNTTSLPLSEKVGIYDEVGHNLLILNAPAAAIWAACDGTATFQQIVAELATRHETGSEFVRHDVWETLRKLSSLGLVVES
jgi:hypothetical protein